MKFICIQMHTYTETYNRTKPLKDRQERHAVKYDRCKIQKKKQQNRQIRTN